jgi:carbon-monoxide dehydrogenase small subunit
MASASATGASEPVGASVIPEFTPTQILNEHFTVAYPPRDVFERFGDVAAMASCLPGVSLTGLPTRDQAHGVIRIKLGPITASFQGSARIERDPADLSGRILGIGGDQRSRSTTQGEIRYRLVPLAEGAATRVELSIGYRVRGTLAQVARAGLVRDLAGRLTADFAGNLARQLAGLAPDPSATASPDLNVAALVIGLLRRRARETFRRIWRR